MASTGFASIAYSLCNLSGSNLEGNGFLAIMSAPVRDASSSSRPANSRAPRPRAVSIDARWPMEYSPWKKVFENHWPIVKGCAMITAIMPCSRIFWKSSMLYLSLSPVRSVANSSICSETSEPKLAFRRMRLDAWLSASLCRSKFSVSRRPAINSRM